MQRARGAGQPRRKHAVAQRERRNRMQREGECGQNPGGCTTTCWRGSRRREMLTDRRASVRRGEALAARSRVPAAAEATARERRPRIQRLADEQWGTKDSEGERSFERRRREKSARTGGGRMRGGAGAEALLESARCHMQRQLRHSQSAGRPQQPQREASARRAAAEQAHTSGKGSFLAHPTHPARCPHSPLWQWDRAQGPT